MIMKAQSGIEGMVLIAIISVILIFVITMFSIRSAEIDSLRVSVEADKLCTVVKSSVNSVLSSGEGAAAEITLPEKIFANGYTARVYAGDKRVVFSWKNRSSTCGILTPNITNSTSGVFDLYVGKNVIRNTGGVVVVSNV